MSSALNLASAISNPAFSSQFFWTGLRRHSLLLPFPARPSKSNTLIQDGSRRLRPVQAICENAPQPSLYLKPQQRRRNAAVFAGRSKKKPGGPSTGRIEGNADVRREAKRAARRKSRRLAENLFYRLKNPHRNEADNFTEDELQMIGLGYDRMVRFMEKDDPNLRQPYDWYKYGEYGPYRWRGIVVGEPIRGRPSDENVTLIAEVKNQEEWEKIEQHEMAIDFGQRLNELDRNVGFKYFWVFVRHPKWTMREPPWEQWTLVSEVVVESGEPRLDKWNLMGRLGNRTRALITQCAAWMRPDILYVKRPIYQCRFEPQDSFFKPLGPLLDPATENDYKFQVRTDDGSVVMCTYFGGLCKIVRANPKAFVDDVVNAYERMSDERRSKCLKFLLSNHPVELLHPYTREWKAKLEEMELGCDAPDGDDEADENDTTITDWIEDDRGDSIQSDEGEEDDAEVVDAEDEVLGIEEERPSEEENEEFWDQRFENALRSPAAMESLVEKSVETSNAFYKKQLQAMQGDVSESRARKEGDGSVVGKLKKQRSAAWEEVKSGPRRRVKRGRIPPELFLRAAIRPFTYRNLVKEIVLMRHAIIDGEIGGNR